jgi:pimeloyl-ACP methyl ester carboxylesterase
MPAALPTVNERQRDGDRVRVSTIDCGYVELDEVRLFYRKAGSGPELVVLLHGWPQTSLCWRHVLPALGDRYTVVAPDLRGYGNSGLASTGYDKRATAADLGQLAARLGHDEALVVGHGRGARVAHRWALDRPDQVRKLVQLNVLPMREVLRDFDSASAVELWHWFFHREPGLPELLLEGRVEPYLRYFFSSLFVKGAIDDEVFAQYVEAFRDPARLHATLEDYRAGFGIDLERDEADHARGHLLAPPLLLLWGADGGPAGRDVLRIWRRYADDVRGRAIAGCGHYIPEEKPGELVAELVAFFAAT